MLFSANKKKKIQRKICKSGYVQATAMWKKERKAKMKLFKMESLLFLSLYVVWADCLFWIALHCKRVRFLTLHLCVYCTSRLPPPLFVSLRSHRIIVYKCLCCTDVQSSYFSLALIKFYSFQFKYYPLLHFSISMNDAPPPLCVFAHRLDLCFLVIIVDNALFTIMKHDYYTITCFWTLAKISLRWLLIPRKG